MMLEQAAPLQLILYELLGTRRAADISEISQAFALRFAAPDESVQVPQPKMASPSYRGWNTRRFRSSWGSTRTILDPELTESVKGLVVSHGDYRHIATKRVVPSELFRPHPLTEEALASHSLVWATRSDIAPGASFGDDLHGRQLVEGAEYPDESRPDFTFDPNDRATFAPLLSAGLSLFLLILASPATLTMRLGGCPMAPTSISRMMGPTIHLGAACLIRSTPILKPTCRLRKRNPIKTAIRNASIRVAWWRRQWRLVRCPVRSRSTPHGRASCFDLTFLVSRILGKRGNGADLRELRDTLEGHEIPQFESLHGIVGLAPDHLWLDQFWMPVSAPFHVGEPFTTHGKVNLNYQMFPFIKIHRATAIHAVLKAERILAIPTHAGRQFKSGNVWNKGWSHAIDAAETLKQFEAKFSRGELFIRESEICEHFLIPEGVQWDPVTSVDPIREFWEAHGLTGDNTLERPYAGIYSRITTRSNSFRVHYRVQAIAKAPEVAPNQIDLTKDRITSDDRGSAVLERQLDLDHPDLPDYLEDIRRLPFLDRLERFYEPKVHRWTTF